MKQIHFFHRTVNVLEHRGQQSEVTDGHEMQSCGEIEERVMLGIKERESRVVLDQEDRLLMSLL
jgi:hypothetical protein